MGWPDLELSEAHYANDKAISALPSPTSVTGILNSPSLRHVSRTQSYASQLSPRDGVLDCAFSPTVPNASSCEPFMTPVLDDEIEPNMNLLVGGALAPVQTMPPPPPPPPKAGPGLRLPSFSQLGIAAPHSGGLACVQKIDTPGSHATQCAHDFPAMLGNEHNLLPATEARRIKSSIQDNMFHPEPGRRTGTLVKSPIHHYVNTITPPAEVSAPDWDSPPSVQIAGMHSPSADPENPASSPNERRASDSMVPTGLAKQDVNDQTTGDIGARSWIDDAIKVLLENLNTASRSTESLKILSHALPSTSTSGHVFTKVINAIHVTTPVSPVTPLTWINVFHAIPGRFNLADLPTSPPNTPGPPVGGDDYFTQKIFDSAVSILDYQEDMTSLPRSPRPIVPPSSIDVSIVERYIPPSTTNEFVEMFDPNGSSILVDRLVELSPENGSLLFIYPTRAGAETFMREYLGPILDPILRTMAVVHGLSSDLSISLGNMRAAHELFDYDSLRRRIVALCARLTQSNTAARRFHGRRPSFTLSYASKQYVKLQRSVWAREWWTKQEKTRLKETINNYHRESQTRRRSISEYPHHSASPTVLLQELLDGVAGKFSQEHEVPDASLEVSVFVVTRTE